MSELAVHPVAALFPMLADDEIEELAADIKARGLLQPIVLDAEGRVLDGRNRLAACEIAGVEPTFVTLIMTLFDIQMCNFGMGIRHRNRGFPWYPKANTGGADELRAPTLTAPCNRRRSL